VIKTIDTIEGMREFVFAARKNGSTVGLVPTMGSLHDGHLSLMSRAHEETSKVVVSIFVNPLQFGPKEDYRRYPRDMEGDTAMCERAGVDVVFAPSVAEIYPKSYQTCIEQEDIANKLCGKQRPGHFSGVMTIVAKLFNIVQPDAAYFGQKDYQQALMIQRMAADLNMNIRVRVLPTVREPDGLAMSSRNAYLTAKQRKQAVCLYRALVRAQEIYDRGVRDGVQIVKEMHKTISAVRMARPDYVSVVDADTLDEVKEIRHRAVAVLAVRIGKARLIDNAILG
jgi:pantoate--beta-alanine ligase